MNAINEKIIGLAVTFVSLLLCHFMMLNGAHVSVTHDAFVILLIVLAEIVTGVCLLFSLIDSFIFDK